MLSFHAVEIILSTKINAEQTTRNPIEGRYLLNSLKEIKTLESSIKSHDKSLYIEHLAFSGKVEPSAMFEVLKMIKFMPNISLEIYGNYANNGKDDKCLKNPGYVTLFETKFLALIEMTDSCAWHNIQYLSVPRLQHLYVNSANLNRKNFLIFFNFISRHKATLETIVVSESDVCDACNEVLGEIKLQEKGEINTYSNRIIK